MTDTTKRKIKVVTGRIGIDEHYWGIIIITDTLRNAGMEVIYLGLLLRVDEIIKTMVQEDADVVGLSFLCGGHLQTMQKFMARIKEEGLDKAVVIVGGNIPPQDGINQDGIGFV